ncbi:MAG: RNB domain-containing ribonuclease [Elusimicrobia bacterium]|nr:RNB domain-containing ribonuclease [Elusimicrobiota bacterium]
MAAGSVFKGAALQVRSRGSSARLTHSEQNPDYDLMARLPQAWSAEQADAAVQSNLPALKAALAESVKRETAFLFPGVETKVSVEGPIGLNDPADGKRADGVYMLPVHVLGPAGLLIDADVSFTRRAEYANDYPDYFASQLSAARRSGGPAAAEALLRDIRLAKRLFTEAIGSYKPWKGGPSGVGVEQMVMQSGGFDQLMARVLEAAYEPNGQPRGLKKARQHWTVDNPFMEPKNFLDLMSEGSWNRLAYAAKAYADAKAAGRPIAMQALKKEKPAPPVFARPQEPALTVIDAPATPSVSLRFTTASRQGKMRGLVLQAVKGLRADKTSLSWQGEDGGNAYQLTLQLAPGADAAAVEKAVRERLLKAEPALKFSPGAAAPAVSQAEAWLYLRARNSSEPRDAVSKAAARFARRLLLGRPEVSARPDAKGAYAVSFPLDSVSREDFSKGVLEFFKKASGVQVLAAAFSGAQAAAPQGPSGPGRLTLAMLERFTTSGPKPSARGDAYLYAQGAKALPAGLEESGAARVQPELPADDRLQKTRAMLLRRFGRAYVMLPTLNEEGMEVYKAVRVPDRLAQGVVTETVVDIAYDEKRVRAVKPVGAYAADVVIGRVSREGGALLLGPLFAGDSAKSLYAPMPISGPAQEGSILQVFVRPAAAGYEAVPLLDLGPELTPEIAAREIALRHGARAYFEESVIRQAEAVGREQDPEADFKRMQAARGRSEDLRSLPFVTIDPVGAGDLDDAYFVRKEADGSYTWYLATADVAQYVKPGTPAFRAAARIGNTFYSVDKDGVSEFPMNHPVVSKSVSSLLAGKDSLAMVSKMRFSPTGEFLLNESEVFLGLVRVQGRYTYDQVAALWKGQAGHGVAHLDQVALARELSAKLHRSDEARGKLELSFTETEHRKGPDGRWGTFVVEHDPMVQESHRLIEELKVYGNRVIAVRLEAIADGAGVPHISRVHPAQEDRVNERLRKELSAIGAPWPEDQTLWRYLGELRSRTDFSAEVKETAQILALRSRSSALYAADDAEGHEGLALQAKAYDHPSTPIRRFSDMYNRALLESYLEGADVKAAFTAMLADLQALGFASLDEYLQHLNGREQAARQMDHEMDEFMSVFELAKPEHKGRQFSGYVKMVRPGRNAEAVIQLRELPVTIILRGEDARPYQLLDEVGVTVKGADAARMKVDAAISKAAKRKTP